MDLLVNSFKKTISVYGIQNTFWVAFSGGLDSHVLLHLLVKLRESLPIKLHVIHVHHGISKNADAWVNHCEEICKKFQVNFFQHKINLSQAEFKDLSPEDFLRCQRYKIFAEFMNSEDILLTAHHKNDQAETLLLQLFRGAGPKGLAAMPKKKSFANGFHARPLLDFTRDELKNYAEQHDLNWLEDESNADVNYTRNFLRHEILPLLQTRWPTIMHTLARVAEHCANTQKVLENSAKKTLLTVLGTTPATLSIKKLLLLEEVEQSSVLRLWIKESGFSLPSAIKMQEIRLRFLLAREDKKPLIKWGKVELRRYRDDLYLLSSLTQHNVQQNFIWDLKKELLIKNIGKLTAELVQGKGVRADISSLNVQFRRGGETCQLPRRSHHHDLKKLFQTWGVAPWLRDRTPLLYLNNTLVAIPGFFIAEAVAAKSDEQGWDIEWSSE